MNANDATTNAAPIAPVERIISLDVLRGVAVLGILIMNIATAVSGWLHWHSAMMEPTDRFTGNDKRC